MKKKTIILLMVLVIVCLTFTSAALAERLNDYDYTVDKLLYASSHHSTDYYLVSLSSQEGKTTALPMDANQVSKGDVYHAYKFDEDNQFLSLENQLRWLANNSLINGNLTASQLRSDINALAASVHGLSGIHGPLSNEDAVAGAQAALMGLASPEKTQSFTKGHSSSNFLNVFCYYFYMLEHGASQEFVPPKTPILSISIEKNTGIVVETVMISDAIFKVVPYVYTHSNNGEVELSLTTAPAGSYINDDTGSTFNVYIPVASLADASGATITMLGTITATTLYTDVCTYAGASKSSSMLLGEGQFSIIHQAQDSDTSSWVFPPVFAYELTLLGKQSQDPVEDVEFTFSNNSGFSQTETTNSGGKTFFGFLPCGNYYLNIDEPSAVEFLSLVRFLSCFKTREEMNIRRMIWVLSCIKPVTAKVAGNLIHRIIRVLYLYKTIVSKDCWQSYFS